MHGGRTTDRPSCNTVIVGYDHHRGVLRSVDRDTGCTCSLQTLHMTVTALRTLSLGWRYKDGVSSDHLRVL